MFVFRRLSFLPALLLLCIAACNTQPQGSVSFAAAVQQALSASSVTRVTVTISASDMTSIVVDLAESNGTWGGLIGNIPAGTNRTFVADAFDASGTKRFQGQTSGVTIIAHQTTAVALTLQELSPQPPYSNEAPLIDSVVAATTAVQTGASLSLTATAHDPNPGDSLTYAWSATGGTFSAPTVANTTWTAPTTLGVQTLTLTVTDSQGAAVSVSLAINVYSGVATGNAAINISFNFAPVVSKVSASLNQLDAGQSTAVSAIASDSDGDTLSYLWSASCPGTWTNDTSSAASFVPSSVPASACNNCRLTVTVQDGRGGQTTGSLNLCVTSTSTQRFPPVFTHYYQSALSASAGQPVTFEVNAQDPQSSTLTFAWSANMGSLATAQNTASTSRVVWTAPACADAGPPPSVTVVVTNAYGLSASMPFALSGLPACATGSSSAGFMATARAGHTSTLLPSGKVLVATGENSSTPAPAELYDPATNSWSSTGSMASPHDSAPDILLPSGKVLVPGGYNQGSATAVVEVYDPATNAWSTAQAMTAARFGHTATRLASGKVLVTGGFNGSFLSSTELYDPTTNTWTPTASMNSVRYLHMATLLPSGKVLVTGGYGSGFFSTTEVYDPATNSWTPTASMASVRYAHTSTLLASGKVLVVGGQYAYYNSHLATAEVYDPATNAWSPAGALTVERSGHLATLLTSGKVLVSGGADNADNPLTSVQVYDPATNSWSSTAPLAVARMSHNATLLNSGKVLISGGIGTTGAYLSSAELYTP
ncbi:High-affinity leucine-specific transport system, periplasmic binding protein LivK [Cystobacter fuscus DSM 2262]|uniref:High-affinity leucine-specific transport system, periplasmic binding protein LivK n=1 Tax=Cystobacter fuscus (strain ATCC 25194 / DSM 2262 / NBRC 100088 / M29) TaxID=1242864 RepID=S9QVW5_CYSF2|nr:kelch repeat-containing protein [Cystobacter fuscus]EPX60818.1 High-affinity leucine-specific transport system, periplasmic binding protein LivK [Cystobacter fuscus DSM 2262]